MNRRRLGEGVRFWAAGLAGIFLLFLACEGAIRWLIPQHHLMLSEGNVDLLQPVPGFREGLLRPGTRGVHRTPEFTADYRINADAMRDEAEHAAGAVGDRVRVLVLGDSFTFGVGNAYEHIWPVVLEREISRRGFSVDVVKAGVMGLNTREELRYLEKLLPKYRPDIVVLAFLAHDLFENTAEIDRDAPDAAGAGRDRIPLSWMAEFHTLRLAKRLVLSSDILYGIIYMATPRREFFTWPLSETVGEHLRVTEELLGRMHRFCESRGSDFLVLSIPQQFQLIAGSRERFFSDVNVRWIDEHLGAFASREGFEWVSARETLTEAYRANPTPLYYRVNGHLTDAGQEIVGQSFADRFMDLYR